MQDAMNRPTVVPRQSTGTGGTTLVSWLASAVLPFLAGHGAAAELDRRIFPPPEVFRQLQLTTLACSRENGRFECEEARKQADGLLDHPRLPTTCKDVLWRISHLSETAPRNSLDRRKTIDEAARDLTIICRQQLRPAAEPQPGISR